MTIRDLFKSYIDTRTKMIDGEYFSCRIILLFDTFIFIFLVGFIVDMVAWQFVISPFCIRGILCCGIVDLLIVYIYYNLTK